MHMSHMTPGTRCVFNWAVHYTVYFNIIDKVKMYVANEVWSD